jgi:hypothetical protein
MGLYVDEFIITNILPDFKRFLADREQGLFFSIITQAEVCGSPFVII